MVLPLGFDAKLILYFSICLGKVALEKASQLRAYTASRSHTSMPQFYSLFDHISRLTLA